MIDPARATILSPCKVIHRNIHRSPAGISISRWPTRGAPGRPAARGDAGALAESLVAYRGKQRWVPCFEPVRLEGGGEPARPLRDNGCISL